MNTEELLKKIEELEDENYSLRLSLTSGGGRLSSAAIVFNAMKKRIKVLEKVMSSAEDVLNSIDWNVTNSMVLDPVYADSLYEALEEARKK